MNTGLRNHRSASVRIEVAEALPEEMRPLTRELVSLKSENPRKGHATSLMWEVCHEADKWWITLFVRPLAFDDGMPDAKLVPFYEGFGFVKIQDEPVLMARSPQLPRVMVAH